MPPAEAATALVFVVYTMIFAIFRGDPRISVAAGLGILAAAAITLASHHESLAENIAIYAYYFLASGVILLLIQHIRGDKDDDSKRDQGGKGK
jgi:hypothetical protein